MLARLRPFLASPQQFLSAPTPYLLRPVNPAPLAQSQKMPRPFLQPGPVSSGQPLRPLLFIAHAADLSSRPESRAFSGSKRRDRGKPFNSSHLDGSTANSRAVSCRTCLHRQAKSEAASCKQGSAFNFLATALTTLSDPIPKKQRRPRTIRGRLFLPIFLLRRPDFSGAELSTYSFTLSPPCGSPFKSSSICSFRYTSELMSYVASSNPWPCVIASVGHASTQ